MLPPMLIFVKGEIDIFVTIYICLKIQNIQACSFKITDNFSHYFEIKVGIALL